MRAGLPQRRAGGWASAAERRSSSSRAKSARMHLAHHVSTRSGLQRSLAPSQAQAGRAQAHQQHTAPAPQPSAAGEVTSSGSMMMAHALPVSTGHQHRQASSSMSSAARSAPQASATATQTTLTVTQTTVRTWTTTADGRYGRLHAGATQLRKEQQGEQRGRQEPKHQQQREDAQSPHSASQQQRLSASVGNHLTLDQALARAAAARNGSAAATTAAAERSQQPQHHARVRRLAPARLLGVVHGSACMRGRQKPEMQDHHLVLQDMLELASHSLNPTPEQQQPQGVQQQGGTQHQGGGDSSWAAALDGPPLQQQQQHGQHGSGAHSQQQHHHSQPQRVELPLLLRRTPDLACSSSLAGVFDGHCGSRSSRYAARRLPALLAHSTQLWAALEGAAHSEGLSSSALSLAAAALHDAFARLDREILDEDRHKPPGEFDGTTALLGLQVGSHLLLANVGDSRAVLCRGQQAVRLTTDHTPDLPDERKRIEACGGYVREHRGVWRLVLPLGPGCGLKICAVSRALGDIDYKEPRPLLSAVPDVFHCALQPHVDRFAIFASDGVWAAVTDQQAVDCVAAALRQARAEGHAPSACAEVAAQALRQLAHECGSGDDITAVVAAFQWEPAASVRSVEGSASSEDGGEGAGALAPAC